MREEEGSQLTVAHSVSTWLNPTMTWVYGQVVNMRRFVPIVLAGSLKDPGNFPFSPVYCSKRRDSGRLFKAIRGLGITTCPRSYRGAIKAHRPVILHSHFADRGWHDLGISRAFGLVHVVTFYGYDVSKLPLQKTWRKRYEELFESADLFLCEGPHMAKSIEALGCPSVKIRIQRLGVDVKRIKFSRREIGADKSARVLISGAFREKKGIPYAIEAIGLLKDRYPRLTVTLVGASTGADLTERAKIRSVIERYGLSGRVRMTGIIPHDELLREAEECQIFLSPSVTSSDGDTEGGAPVTIIEMQAAGLPVISTRHADIPFVAIDGKSALLFDERDPVGLANGIARLMESPKGELGRMGEEGRAHVEELHDIRKTVIGLEQVYLDVLDARGVRGASRSFAPGVAAKI